MTLARRKKDTNNGGSLTLLKAFSGRYRSFLLRSISVAVLALALISSPAIFFASAQEKQEKKDKKDDPVKKDDSKVPTQKEIEEERKNREKAKAGQPQLSPVEIVAEATIFAYGGRQQLQTARNSFQEDGNIRLATDQGDITGTYMIRSLRKEKSWLDLMRTDLELSPPEEAQRQGAPPSIKYTIAFNGASIWSAQNNQYVAPRPEAEASYKAQLVHDYTALLRYKEDGSKLELKDPETVVGVPTYVVEMTTEAGEKTRYWISKNSFRIVHAEYELKLADQSPIKYRVSYYYTPVRVVQNTLVPARRVMMQDGKFAQEMTVTALNSLAKFEPEVFQHLQGQ
jgi:hypothetical protein